MTTSKLTHARQRGAVLIVAMVLLVVLTLLGISVMNTTQLEERMASNAQEVVQAFQSAETGLSQAYANDLSWSLTTTVSVANTAIPSGIGRSDQAGYTTEYLAWTNPPSESDQNFLVHHFDFRSVGQSQSGFDALLHGGGSILYKKTGLE